MMKNGQTWMEFIITTVLFIFVVGFLFFNAVEQVRTEIDKENMQTSCLKSITLENLLEQPGSPMNWDSAGNVTIFGLSNANRTAVSLQKWLKAEQIGFSLISQNSTPSSPWQLSYKIYAFEPNIDVSCSYGNAITICRGNNSLNIIANSSLQSLTKLTLFFPFSTATINSATNESDDQISVTTGNGTKLYLLLNTNQTDQDLVNASFTPRPNLIFIEQAQIESSQNLTLILGNKYAIDSFGAITAEKKGLCTTKIKKIIDFANETILADFELQAW